MKAKDIENMGLIVRGYTQLVFSQIDHEKDKKSEKIQDETI